MPPRTHLLSPPTVIPISPEERKARVTKAQSLLRENKMDALILDAGTSLYYFTGVRWWPSERTMVLIIPAKGEVEYVCPAFEEDRLKELIPSGSKVSIWQEDESPYRFIADAIAATVSGNGQVAIEERTRFFIADGLQKAAPQLRLVSGDAVTIPCRLIKSPAELALLQIANDYTVAAIKACIAGLKTGISQREAGQIVDDAHQQLGAEADGALILFGEAASLPHGSVKPRHLKKGDIVLMDCGCRVEGYTSDITRTIVYGAAPNERQLQFWNLEKKAQAAGFAAARIGAACEAVDAAARGVIVSAGFGPGYRIPGLPHRTGHGIGLDGHEWGNMLRGNKLALQAGMCFSIEPTIILPGEFGVRLEDCVYMTENGARWFSPVATAIDKPFG